MVWQRCWSYLLSEKLNKIKQKQKGEGGHCCCSYCTAGAAAIAAGVACAACTGPTGPAAAGVDVWWWCLCSPNLIPTHIHHLPCCSLFASSFVIHLVICHLGVGGSWYVLAECSLKGGGTGWGLFIIWRLALVLEGLAGSIRAWGPAWHITNLNTWSTTSQLIYATPRIP